MDPYKYQSMAEVYRSMYSKPTQPAQDKRVATQYAEKRDEKTKDRQKQQLKVEASDLAFVLNALIEDGTVSSDRIKEIMTEKLETGPEYHARMKADRKPINQFPVDKNKKPAAKPAAAKPDTRTDVQKMADAYASHNRRPGGPIKAD
jgi:hypothetical protein